MTLCKLLPSLADNHGGTKLGKGNGIVATSVDCII